MDTSIFSDSIITNFNSIEAIGAYKHVDYQYNFLNHLAEKYNPGCDLYTLVDSFIERFKHEFSLADIVITKTGVTRCKTNIRFALNDLRELGLVLTRDKNGKRSWEPSILGLIVLLNIRFNIHTAKAWKNFKYVESFWVTNVSGGGISSNPNKLLGAEIFDPTLMNSLNQLKTAGYIYEYLDKQGNNILSIEEKKVIEGIIDDYIEFTNQGLEIKESGIKKTELFDELSKKFLAKLFSKQQENYQLLDKLFLHFRDNEKIDL